MDTFERNKENCILIESFIDDKSDTYLQRLVPLLELLDSVEDVRRYLGSRHWDETITRLMAAQSFHEDEGRVLLPREETMDEGHSQVNPHSPDQSKSATA